MIDSPARAKESQKAQQRVASAMEGIYDGALSGFLRGITKPPRNVPRNTPDDRGVFLCPDLYCELEMASNDIEVPGCGTEDEDVVDPRSVPN